MMSDYKVEMINDGMQEFFVDFHGPNDSMLLFILSLSLLVSFLILQCMEFIGSDFVFFLFWVICMVCFCFWIIFL